MSIAQKIAARYRNTNTKWQGVLTWDDVLFARDEMGRMPSPSQYESLQQAVRLIMQGR